MINSLPKAGIVLPVVFVCMCTQAFAQRSVTGKVTSADENTGMPGVNVLEKGTTNGTATDADGKFSLMVGENSILVFTTIGYATQEIPVGALTTIDVVMQPDITALSEVVVTGYGSQSKSDITGAVATIDNKQLLTTPSTN